MFRTVLLILTITYTQISAAQGWDEQSFQVDVVASHQKQQVVESQTASSVAVNAHLTKLFQGFGLNAAVNLAEYQPNDSLFSTNTNYQAQLNSRVFLSANVNLDVGVTKNRQLTPQALGNAIYRPVQSDYELQDVEMFSSAFNFGSDQSRRALKLAFSHVGNDVSLSPDLTLFQSDKNQIFGLYFQNKVSEDTFVVLQFNQSRFDKEFTGLVDNSLDIQQILIGMKTSYLSNSQIEVLLGSDNTVVSGQQGQRDRFSWRVNNRINVSDYLVWELGLTQQTTDSNDPTFVATENEELSSKVNYLLSDNTKLGVELSLKNRHYGMVNGADAKSSQKHANFSVDYQVLEQLTLSSTIALYDNEDTREEYVFDGFQWQLGVHWRLI